MLRFALLAMRKKNLGRYFNTHKHLMDKIIPEIKDIILSYTFKPEAVMWSGHVYFSLCHNPRKRKLELPTESPFSDEFLTNCVANGLLNVLKWLKFRGHKINFTPHFTATAASCQQWEVLKWLREPEQDCPWHDSVCYSAAQHGRLDILKWSRSAKEEDKKCPWKRSNLGVCAAAAEYGHLDILKWLLEPEQEYPYSKYFLNDTSKIRFKSEEKDYSPYHWACLMAAKGGNINILEWLRMPRKKQSFGKKLCSYAAEGGQLHVLKWLRAPDQNYEWDDWVCAMAARGGHLSVLKWLCQEAGPVWHTVLNEYAPREAARNGHFEVLKWLRNNGCPFTVQTSYEAAKGGHLHILKWLHNKNLDTKNVEDVEGKEIMRCPWDSFTCAYAAEYGHFEVLKWLREQGCPINLWSAKVAIRGGNFEILEWLRNLEEERHKCPWGDESFYRYAIEGGHLEILKWLRAPAQGCPWRPEKDWCTTAARHDNIDLLKWLNDAPQNCQWNEYTCSTAIFYGNFKLADWLRAPPQNCPCSFYHTFEMVRFEGITRALESLKTYIRKEGVAGYGFILNYKFDERDDW